MIAGRYLLVFFVLVFSISTAWSQTKSQLQKEKEKNLAKIKEVEGILTQTTARKKNTLGELNALNQRIQVQEKLISSIQGEVSLLDEDIKENTDIIDALEEDLSELKKEYAAMLYAAQKANNSVTKLTFLFSAASFDQFIMRLRYMEQYSATRKIQAEQITKVQVELTAQVNEIKTKRDEKTQLLDEEMKESNNLVSLKQKQNSLIKTLAKEERSLKQDLENTRKAIARLDKLINDLIKEEMARAARENPSSDAVALSSSFADNKSKFPWPVNGFVSQKFGKQNHPVLKGIVLQNDGVNIQCKEQEKVRTIFDGEVRQVAYVQMFGGTIIISHGEYYTVYAGLKDIQVKKGDKVKARQEIGSIQANTEGVPELRFQIRKNTTALDPQTWLQNL
jgi:septal ring factor EnvC (AmiA/AmiB activator)